MQVVETLTELDKSGGDNKRPQRNEAIQMVESGQVKGMVVWNFARFGRSTRDALNALSRIESAGGWVYSATESFGTDPSGKMMRTILLAGAAARHRAACARFG